MIQQALLWAAAGTGFTFLMTTIGAAMVFFMKRQSSEKVLYFEPQPSEQTAALKTVLVRMGVRIKNVEAVSAGQTVGFLLNRKGFEPTDETADAPSAPMMVLDGFTEKRLDILLREMKAYGVSVPYKAMVTEHNIGWTLSDLFTELVREHEAMHR